MLSQWLLNQLLNKCTTASDVAHYGGKPTTVIMIGVNQPGTEGFTFQKTKTDSAPRF
ncbi:hypothetical protein HH172_000370 [Escherichia coli]|uniref:Uncharacterized protein n=1 Tax=Escherichia coli TaxID=562 RepID=A0A781TFP4_ECOLX|nr:hypothetical protein [Escherichia coli]EFH2482798.1 hypothetical protein [Escherichia coli]EFH2515249.1 hypothetical protein [Escherichia coli]EFH2971872.1 hypothetical protein [Escherichia coli]EFI3444204.1 hypothetical protein [Escherichia coli]